MSGELQKGVGLSRIPQQQANQSEPSATGSISAGKLPSAAAGNSSSLQLSQRSSRLSSDFVRQSSDHQPARLPVEILQSIWDLLLLHLSQPQDSLKAEDSLQADRALQSFLFLSKALKIVPKENLIQEFRASTGIQERILPANTKRQIILTAYAAASPGFRGLEIFQSHLKEESSLFAYATYLTAQRVFLLCVPHGGSPNSSVTPAELDKSLLDPYLEKRSTEYSTRVLEEFMYDPTPTPASDPGGAELESYKKSGASLLLSVVWTGRQEILGWLLSNFNSEALKNALNQLVSKDATYLNWAVRKMDFKAIELLLGQNADVNQRDQEDYTPLCCAVLAGNLEMAKFLLDQGADVNGVDRNGRTLLHNAVGAGNLKVAKFLLDRGADVNQADQEGTTPFHRAVSMANLEMVKILFNRGADVNQADQYGITPLHRVFTGHLEMIRFLLDQGADVNRADQNGRTPLHLAVLSGHLGQFKLLLGRGADVNRTDRAGKTPLGLAIKWHWKMVPYLLGRYVSSTPFFSRLRSRVL